MIEDRGLDTSETIIENAEADSGTDAVLMAQADTGSDPAGTPPSDPSSSGGAPGISVIVPDADNRVTLAASASIEDIQLDGNDLLLVQPDGSQIRIIGGALSVPTFVIGDIELPQEVLVAALETSGFNVAAGPGNTLSVSPQAPTGSGGEFEDSSGASIAGDGLNTLSLLGDTSGAGDGGAGAAFDEDTGNIASVLTGGVSSGGIVESVDNPGGVDADPVAATGSITFFDPDFGETRTAEISASNVVSQVLDNGGTLTAAQLDALLAGFSLDTPGGITVESTTAAGGSIDWTYAVGNEAVDFLAAGEVITLAFDVRINDGIFSVTQTVTVTVTGTNDAPEIQVVDVTGGVTDVAEASQSAAQDAAVLQTTGSITFTDVDLTDRPVATEATKTVVGAAQGGGVLALTAAQQAAIEAAFTITNVAANTNDGTVNWDYSIAEGAIDFLGAGESVTATFTITVTDDEGATAEQDVTITITGSNDTPEIQVVDVTGGVTDVAEASQSAAQDAAVLQTTGSITFTDVDLTDRPVATEATKTVVGAAQGGGVLALTAAQQAAIEAAFTITNVAANTNDGTVNWDYSIAEGAIDFLGAGESVTATFTITVTDDEGATAEQDVTITITGSNDTPEIQVVDVTGGVTDVAEASQSAAQDAAVLQTTGSITFTDVDLTDRPVATEATKTVVGAAQGGGVLALTAAQQAAIEAAFTITNVAANTNDGTVNWDYSIAEGAIDFLGAGESVTATFTITVTDDEGATAEQDVTITITGSNDTPEIQVVDVTGGVTDVAEASQSAAQDAAVLQTTGSITFTDVDLTDRPVATEATKTVVGAAQGGGVLALTAAQQAAIEAAFTITNVAANTNDGTVNWDYSIAEGAIDFLGAGESVTATFTITVTDDEGATAEQDVTITITGSNDTPEIQVVDVTGGVTDVAEASQSAAQDAAVLQTTGSITFTDVDLTDRPVATEATKTVVGAAQGGGVLALTAAQQAAIEAAFTITNVAANTNDGTVNWDYSIAEGAIDFLGAGESVTATFTITVTDDEGATAEQDVTITITGSNDTPEIQVVDVTGGVTDVAEASQSAAQDAAVLQTTGSITFTDVDLTDRPVATEATKTVVGAAQGGGVLALTAAQQAAIEAAFTITNVAANTNDGTVNWDYSIAEGAIDFLGAGESVTATFTITVTDDEGATAEQDVTITITGSNDTPEIQVVDVTGGVTDVAEASQSAAQDAAVLQTTGSITFTDVDLTDRPVATEATKTVVGAAQGGGVLALTAAQQAAIEAAFTITNVAANTNDGTVNWDYSIAEGAIDFLGAGESVTATFTITVTDDEGATAEQDVTITITGSNDTPEIQVVDVTGGVTDVAEASQSAAQDAAVLQTTGSITFTDVDLTDRPVATEATKTVVGAAQGGGVLALTAAQQAAIEAAFTITNVAANTNDGTVNWDYSIAEGAIDFLGAGESVTATFTITVTDDEGATAEQDVTITITGSNDTPEIQVVDVTGGVTDVAEASQSAAQDAAVLQTTGSITFTDVDLTDRPVATEATKTVVGAAQGGGVLALTAAQQAAIEAAFTITNVAANTNDGTVNWDYSIAEGAIDFLGAGESVTATFTITVTDDEGATAEQDVTITITGSNDTPEIQVVDVTGGVTDVAEASQSAAQDAAVLQTTGSITFTDVDLTDRPVATEATKTVVGAAQGGGVLALTAAQQAAIEAAFTITNVAANTNDGTVNWDYSIAEGAIDFLGAGESVTATFTITVTDDEGATAEQDVTITITGSNDTPEIQVVDVTGGVTDVAEASQSAAQDAAVLQTTGSITFTDVDLTDRPVATEATKTVVGAAQGGGVLALTAAQQAAIEAAFTITNVAANTNDGTVNWDYSIAEGAIDFLGAGESVTATFTITVTDDEGATAEQDVTITITGSNDTPEIQVVDVTGGVTDVAEASQSAAQDAAVLQTTGSITFTDVDLTDRPVATEATKTVVGAAQGGGVLALTAAQQAAIEAAFTITNVAANTNDGTVNWDYSIAEGAIDFLGAGESVTATFTITVTDDEGATAEQDVTITITGSNDTPEIQVVDVTGGVTDVAEASQSAAQDAAVLQTTGSITFTDVDLTDRPVATEATKTVVGAAQGGGVLALTAAQQAAIEAAFTITNVAANTNDGTVNWDYSIAEGAIDFLGAGESVTATFTITVTDDEGATAEQDVTITITGSNDTPEIQVVDVTGGVTDVAEASQSAAQDAAVLQTTGSITFTDVDLTDRPVATEATKTVVGAAQGGGVLALTAAQQAAIEAAFTITNVAANTNDGTVNWDYSIAEGAIDFLGAGESVTATFTITVTDDEGATAEQDVTITITGSNDTPEIQVVDVTGGVTDVAEASQSAAQDAAVLQTTGSITFTDVDLTDRPVATEATKTVVGAAQGGGVLALTAAQQAAIEAAFTITNVAANTNDGTVNWDYSIAEGAIDFLGAGESVTATFTITVTDDEGATAEQDVTITITGSNDTPEIQVVDVTGGVTDVAEASQSAAQDAAVLQTTGSITFTDVDLTDRPVATEATKTVVGAAQGGGVLALTAAQQAAIEAAFTITNAAANTNDGTVNWDYSIAEGAIDFLGAGESVTATFTITVTDDEGATAEQDVTITITGSNDTPEIDATSVITGSVTESGDIADINEAGFGGSLSSDVALSAGSQGMLDGLQTDGSGLEAALTAITGELGDASQAIAVIWDYLDDNYVNGGPTQDPINEAFIRLGAAYAGLLKAGTISPLVDMTAKYTADNNGNSIPQRVQSLHDNLLGNVSSAAIAQRFGGDALETTLTNLVSGVDANLLTRPYYSGNEGTSDTDVRNFDIANGYVEAASGQLTATDVDNGETAQLLWSGDATGIYGTFSIDANTGEWVYKLDNSLAPTQALTEGQSVTDSFVATVTDPHLATDTVTVTITITGTNDAPVIEANSVVTGAATEDADSTAPSTAIADFTALSTDIGLLLADPGYNDDMAAVLQSVLTMPGVTSMADAITAVWQHLDANYGSYYINDVNEAFARLGLEYAEYIQGGGSPLNDVIAKFQADNNGNGIPQRLQSLHDNLLGNLDGPSLADKFLAAPDGSNNADPQPALHAELTQAIDDLGLTGRPIYGGYEGQANNALAFDQANGLLPAASGQLVASDVDSGETAQLQWSGDATGTYGNFAIDTDTGVWTYFVNNGAAATQALAAGQTETETFTAVVTDPQGATDTIDVTITITGTNDAPVISASATREFVRGFDDATDTIDDSTGSGWGVVSLVASGTNGIATEDGSGYALISEAAGNGPFTRFDGYRSDWTGDWTAEVKVYLDTSWANGTGFDYTVAASNASGGHLRDFIFHVTKDSSTGELLVAGSNNTNFAPREDLDTINHYQVTTSGWYTLQHRFYEDGGVLKVDLNLVDGNGTVLWTETRTNAGDTIPGTVGGNRYGWFTVVDVPGGLAVDGLGLNVDGTETRVAEFASGAGGLHTAGGEIPFTDVDLLDGHTVSAVPQAGGYLGVFNAQINAGDEATGGNTGVISWTFEVAEPAIDYLAAGESLTQVYTVTVDDGNGGTDTQDVTITITGTNDAPVITDGPVAVTYAEAVDVAGASGQGVLTGDSLTGSLAFNDVDVTDTQTFQVVSATRLTGGTGGMSAAAFDAAALALMSVAGSASSTGATTGGSINWEFNASDDFFDYLKTGESVEIEYVVEVSDGKGGTATQTITVTVNGANDVLFTDNGETVDLTVLTAADAQDGNYLDAMDGDDIVTLPDAGDALAGEYGPGKVFNAGNGSDVVNGGDMDDTINGGGGSDQIFGNGGNDDPARRQQCRRTAWRHRHRHAFGRFGRRPAVRRRG
jgi:VCBS repeat-containing protein